MHETRYVFPAASDGKIGQWTIQNTNKLSSQRQNKPVDATDIKQKLRAFICVELMQQPDYTLEDDQPIVSGGLIDSFSIVRVGLFMEAEYDMTVPNADLTYENMDTLNLMANYVLRKKNVD